MIYILLSIICNITVSVLLKLARRYNVDLQQAITWNYSIAALLTFLFLGPELSSLRLSALPFPVYAGLAILLPSLFVVIGLCIKYNGIVRTDVAQRLSLFIPVLAAFVIFDEPLAASKITGIFIGFAAILCSIPWSKGNTDRSGSANWGYLLIVFLGMGLIDILFKQVAGFKEVSYSTSLFIIYVLAFVISIAGLLFLTIVKKTKLSVNNMLSGWLLGAANFGNILFYLKAHQSISGKPSLVFSVMNIGVISAGALVGLWFFNEKLSKLNKAGIVLAVISILVITLF